MSDYCHQIGCYISGPHDHEPSSNPSVVVNSAQVVSESRKSPQGRPVKERIDGIRRAYGNLCEWSELFAEIDWLREANRKLTEENAELKAAYQDARMEALGITGEDIAETNFRIEDKER